jgi:hypothetical protein
MNATLNIQRLLPFFLGCLFIASTSFIFCYLAILFFLFPCFLVVCIIDLVKKTRLRKNAGLLLATMYVAGIVALVIFYLRESFL